MIHDFLSGRLAISNEAVNASHNYTSEEIDLFTKILAAVAREPDKEKRRHLRLSYGLLCSPGDTGIDYRQIRKAFRGLISKPLEIYYKETQQYFMCSLVSAMHLNKNSGVILVEIHPKILDLIIETRANFTTLEIASILGLRGKYSKRLYMLASQFKATGIRYTSFDEMRKLFKLEKKYALAADFRRRVLDPAVKEISAITELNISYEVATHGRKIDEFIIHVKYNEAASITASLANQIKFMEQMGLAPWQVKNTVNSLSESEIHKILYDFSLIKNTIKNKGGYLAKILDQAGVNMSGKGSTQTNIFHLIEQTEDEKKARAI